jgi:branched-chain amino acid aminotransferase
MSMADRDGFIWYDGKLVPWREANTHVLTHSLHYGLAVLKAYVHTKPFLAPPFSVCKSIRIACLASAHIYRMPMPWDKATLMEAQKEVVRANKLESCYIRPIAFMARKKWASRRVVRKPMWRLRPGRGVLIWVRKAWKKVSGSKPQVTRATT